jgi:hypothetical protein
MPRVQVTQPEVEIEFTDARLTGQGDWVFLGQLLKHLQLAGSWARPFS